MPFEFDRRSSFTTAFRVWVEHHDEDEVLHHQTACTKSPPEPHELVPAILQSNTNNKDPLEHYSTSLDADMSQSDPWTDKTKREKPPA